VSTLRATVRTRACVCCTSIWRSSGGHWLNTWKRWIASEPALSRSNQSLRSANGASELLELPSNALLLAAMISWFLLWGPPGSSQTKSTVAAGRLPMPMSQKSERTAKAAQRNKKPRPFLGPTGAKFCCTDHPRLSRFGGPLASGSTHMRTCYAMVVTFKLVKAGSRHQSAASLPQSPQTVSGLKPTAGLIEQC
jgi:hypothetical protein